MPFCSVTLTTRGATSPTQAHSHHALDCHLPCLTWKPQYQKPLACSSLRASGPLTEPTRTPSLLYAGLRQKRELQVVSWSESVLAWTEKASSRVSCSCQDNRLHPAGSAGLRAWAAAGSPPAGLTFQSWTPPAPSRPIHSRRWPQGPRSGQLSRSDTPAKSGQSPPRSGFSSHMNPLSAPGSVPDVTHVSPRASEPPAQRGRRPERGPPVRRLPAAVPGRGPTCRPGPRPEPALPKVGHATHPARPDSGRRQAPTDNADLRAQSGDCGADFRDWGRAAHFRARGAARRRLPGVGAGPRTRCGVCTREGGASSRRLGCREASAGKGATLTLGLPPTEPSRSWRVRSAP